MIVITVDSNDDDDDAVIDLSCHSTRQCVDMRLQRTRQGIQAFLLDRDIISQTVFPSKFLSLFTWRGTFHLPPPPSADVQYKAMYR